MNKRIRELAEQAWVYQVRVFNEPDGSRTYSEKEKVFDQEKFAELMIVEFCDVVKSTANELNEHYFRQGASEEEVLMRVNGALVVLGHIRARFTD
jgi:hypothetical protein